MLSVSSKQGALHSYATSHPMPLPGIGNCGDCARQRCCIYFCCVHACRRPPSWSFWHLLIVHPRGIRYLMKVPCLCAGWDTKVAFLASLRELCVTDSTSNTPTIKIALESEPAFGAPCAAFTPAAAAAAARTFR